MYFCLLCGCLLIWTFRASGSNLTSIPTFDETDYNSTIITGTAALSTQRSSTQYDSKHTTFSTHTEGMTGSTETPDTSSQRRLVEICFVNQHFSPVICESTQYCCGEPPDKRCCPKLSSGAIFGIVSSAIVVTVFVVCSVVACCLWCDICPYRRSRLKKKTNASSAIYNPSGSNRTGHYDTKQFSMGGTEADTCLKADSSLEDHLNHGNAPNVILEVEDNHLLTEVSLTDATL